MILYNMRFRGPLEYDKFVLNVMQYSNEVNMIIRDEFNEEGQHSLSSIKNVLNDHFYSIVGKSNIDPQLEIRGSGETLYYKILEMKEC